MFKVAEKLIAQFRYYMLQVTKYTEVFIFVASRNQYDCDITKVLIQLNRPQTASGIDGIIDLM